MGQKVPAEEMTDPEQGLDRAAHTEAVRASLAAAPVGPRPRRATGLPPRPGFAAGRPGCSPEPPRAARGSTSSGRGTRSPGRPPR